MRSVVAVLVLVFMVLVLLWVIPDSDPSLSRWDRVSLIVSTRMGERLPVLRIGAPGSIAASLGPYGRPTLSGFPCALYGCISAGFSTGYPVPRAGGGVSPSD